MIRRFVPRAWKVIAIASVIVMIPVAVLAAVGSFSSTTATPAVSARNSSSTSGAKAVWGYESGAGSSARYGVYGSASGTGGYGVFGSGSNYGVFSNGPLGVASGKSLVCGSCVSAADMAVKPPTSATASLNTFTGITSCAAQDSITIVAPHTGTILVMADFAANYVHTNGTVDEADFFVETAAGSCPTPGPYNTFSQIAGSLPSDSYFTPLHITHPFSVAAGSHTFYLNGVQVEGGTVTKWRDNMNAIFISS